MKLILTLRKTIIKIKIIERGNVGKSKSTLGCISKEYREGLKKHTPRNTHAALTAKRYIMNIQRECNMIQQVFHF